jgi:hypothetical protein
MMRFLLGMIFMSTKMMVPTALLYVPEKPIDLYPIPLFVWPWCMIVHACSIAHSLQFLLIIASPKCPPRGVALKCLSVQIRCGGMTSAPLHDVD